MRLHARQPHISPDLQTSHSPLPTNARRAVTPLAYSHFTQAAGQIAQPSTRAGIPSGLEGRLINILNTPNNLGAIVRKTLGLRRTNNPSHQEDKQWVAHTLNKAINQIFHQKPNKAKLEQHTLALIRETQESTPRIKKYVQKALPEAMKWLKEHEHILSTLPRHVERKHTEWASACFQNAQPWNIAKQQLNLKTTVHHSMITSNPLLQEHTQQIEQVIQNTFEQPEPPYQLLYQHPTLKHIPITSDHPDTPFYGGYFKAHKKSEHPLLPATRVRTISGQVYELMNRLNPRDARLLRQQHDLSFSQAKIILGQGGYGKVRLARNVNTGKFVAVKKFVPKHNNVPFIYATPEAEQLKAVHRAAQVQNNTSPLLLDTTLDLAHVSIPDQLGGNPKSYLFTPLANLGDGEAMRHRITEYQNMGNSAAAQQLFLELAQQYTLAVSQLHQLGFHHRDIKLKNFLHQGSANNIKARLADFGAMQTNSFVNDYAGGTLKHLPPEAIRRDETNLSPYAYHAEKHDLFGLGLCLLELKLGQDPRLQRTTPHLQLRYQDGTHKAATLSFNEVDSSCQGVADDLLQHLTPNHIDNQIALLLAYNPNFRPSAHQVQAALSKETI